MPTMAYGYPAVGVAPPQQYLSRYGGVMMMTADQTAASLSDSLMEQLSMNSSGRSSRNISYMHHHPLAPPSPSVGHRPPVFASSPQRAAQQTLQNRQQHEMHLQHQELMQQQHQAQLQSSLGLGYGPGQAHGYANSNTVRSGPAFAQNLPFNQGRSSAQLHFASPHPQLGSPHAQLRGPSYSHLESLGPSPRSSQGQGPLHFAPGAVPVKQKRRGQKGLEENVQRTVYISYVHHQVTEEQLAMVFQECGRVLDCRICGDPNSIMRFAFIEFYELESAERALSKTGIVLGGSGLRVLPSKTAIMPVSREMMPRTSEDIERCSRTVYAANIDKKVDNNDVRNFFETLCGHVSKIRLLGDHVHSTRIAFVEFVAAESALAALNCSGALLGSLPVRVSPSKTPVRPDAKDVFPMSMSTPVDHSR
ncbi:MAG: hypothetical protein WDW36_006705 [Sanguina aurantia]